MVFQAGQSVARLSTSTLRCLVNRRTGLSSSRVERVPADYNVFQSQRYSDLVFKYKLISPILRRAYAQRAVSRPKAHTGRTTTAARKAPTTSKTKAAKVPAAKKTTPKAIPKAKSKAKPRINPKPKPAKKKKAAKAKAKVKAKPKPKPKPKAKRPKKVLTEAEKTAVTKRQLKTTALKTPHGVPYTRWGVFLAEKTKAADKAVYRNGIAGLSKEASMEYKQMTPEQLEHYNHLANQNKAANDKAYRQWIESHTPTVIHAANLARLHLKRLGVLAKQLQDHRQVTGPRGAYNYFYSERLQSGDFRGLKMPEAARLVGREWNGLSANQKKPYNDLGAQDMARYTQERKTVLNKDVHFKKSAS